MTQQVPTETIQLALPFELSVAIEVQPSREYHETGTMPGASTNPSRAHDPDLAGQSDSRILRVSKQSSIASRRQAESDAALRNVCCFLPARGGVGTSVLCRAIARALAVDSTPHTLLANWDPADEEGAGQQYPFVSFADITAGQPLRAGDAAAALARFASDYEIVCADLSGNLESFSTEILRQSATIFVVAASDAVSLNAARTKIAFLAELGLLDRTGLILRGSVSDIEPVEEACGVPVTSVIPGRIEDAGATVAQLAAWIGHSLLRSPAAA